MLHQTQIAPATAELIGDIHPLIEQLGSPDGLAALAGDTASLASRQIATATDLRLFLQNYHAKILKPVELPAIHTAFLRASRNEIRELLEFDRQMSNEAMLQPFASASKRVGQGQLQRLRPLRDQRMLKRYLAAVELGEASGWHTLVYGVTLAIYSLPLRQGLAGYAQQTTRGFIQAAARSLKLSADESQKMLEEISGTIPGAVEALLARNAIA